MLQYVKSFGLALLLSVGVGSVGKATSLVQNNCEEGAESMAEVYACLAIQNYTGVETEYDNLKEALAARGMSDVLELLEASQSAWINEDYCGVLQEIARPSWGLYSQDLFTNCENERGAQKTEALKLLRLAVEQGQFEHWTIE